MKPPVVSPEDEVRILEAARQALGPSISQSSEFWKEFAARFGVSVFWIRSRLDPRWAAARRRLVNKNRASRAGGVSFGRVPPKDVLARLAEIPPDTRDNTGRLCGDPVFERSALSRRGQA